jgi:hypothetical protein
MATISIDPPLGLHMVGYIRRYLPAAGYAEPLQVNALVLDNGDNRVVLCGVDNAFIQAPEVDAIRTRIGEAVGADPAGILINYNHTHCAPPGGKSGVELGAWMGGDLDERTASYIVELHEKVVSAARLAADRLEPASVVWGLGSVDISVNRREIGPDGKVVLGWRPDRLVDQQVTVLQARRPDDSVIGTMVGYGCHPVTASMDSLNYTADFPGPMRDAVRQWTGGDCLFMQGAGANVLPRVAFKDGAEAKIFGRRLGLAALEAIADRPSRPREMRRVLDGSLTPIWHYRFAEAPGEPTVLSAVEETVRFPLMPLPDVEEIRQMKEEYAAKVAEERASGTPSANLNRLLYQLNWARRTLAQLTGETVLDHALGTINAVRIGEGGIVTGPGEIFTEIGMAVKERSPATPTFYAGYTNGLITYFPTAESYAEGGYEVESGHRSAGLPSQPSPECERILVERGVRLMEKLFPEKPAYEGEGWTASGSLPTLPPETYIRPEQQT